MASQVRRLSICKKAAGVAAAVMGAVALIPGVAQANDYSISRVAGITGSSAAATPGLALSSAVGTPYSVVTDGLGNLFVSDYTNNAIYKIAADGTLSRVAASVAFNRPVDLYVDAAGNLIVSDYYNYLVRQISSGGTATTLAGNGSYGVPSPGPATSTHIGTPWGLVKDAAGDLYISDANENRIYKVTTSGQISIIGGTGSYGAAVPGPAASSPLAIPQGMAIDADGNLFVALYYSKEIVKITPSGTLSVVAGTGAAGTPVAGPATSSPLGNPYAVAVDPAGDLFIAGGNSDVEEVTPDGQLAVIAGNNTAGAPTYGSVASTTSLTTPKGIAVGTNGQVYVTDTGNNTLDELTPLFPDTQTAPAITGATTVGDALSSDNGTWSNAPTNFSYQWERCDSTGDTCTAITGATSATYNLASIDVGSTLRTQVTALNAHGSQTAVTAPSAVIQAAAIAPPPTTTTTTTTTPTPTTGVGQPVNQIAPTIAGTPTIGQFLEASVGGWTGTDLTYRYQWLRDGVAIPGATGVDYRVSGADSGHKLSVEVVASDGTTSVAAASQTLTALSVDARGCTAPSGRLTASAVGGVQLGMIRTSARRLVKSTQRLNGYTDNLCLAGGYGIRVGYANATMLGHGTLRSLSSRIVFATTANPYYTLDGARPGMTVASVTKRLHLARPITIGPNTWYVIPGTSTNHVLKTRGGVIQEIGDLNRALTRTRNQQGRLLRFF